MSKLTCLVCLQKFSHIPEHDITSSYQPRLLSSPPTSSEGNLYTRFLHFCTRHLKLTSLPLNGREDEVFCPKCKCLVSCLCDLWHEMEVVKLHLGWKLNKLGEMFKVSGKNSRAEKDLIKRLDLDSVRVRRFRAEVRRTSVRRRECNPKVVVSNRILSELWKFSYSETKTTLARLIFVFALAFDKVQRSSTNQPSTVKKEESDLPNDAENYSGGEDLNEFTNSGHPDWSNAATPPGLDSDPEFTPVKPNKRRIARKRRIKMDKSQLKKRMKKRGPYRRLPEPTCKMCGVDLNILSELETHMISTHETDEKFYYCWFCPERFSLTETRLVHRWNGPNHTRKMFKCDFENCQQSFHCPDKHDKHLISHLDSNPATDGSQEEAIKHCVKCNLGFFHPDQLEYHELNHLESIEGTLTCPKCTNSFPEKELLLLHYKQSHLPSLPTLECDLPEAGDFAETINELSNDKDSDWSNPTSPPDLDSDAEFIPVKRKKRKITRRRKKMEQTQPKWRQPVEDIKCSMCPQIFRTSTTLVEHLKLEHSIKKPSFKCGICDKIFESFYVMRKHRKSHGPPPLLLHEAQAAPTPRKAPVKSRPRRVPKTLPPRRRGRPYKTHRPPLEMPDATCKICGEDLKTLPDLYTHMISTHETTEKSHSCWFCSERFSRKETRLVHKWNVRIVKHSGLFKCDYSNCQESFECADKHEEHLQSHLESAPPAQSNSDVKQEPFKAIHHCPKCNLGFFNPDHLEFHDLNHLDINGDTFKCPKCISSFSKLRFLLLHYRSSHLSYLLRRKEPSLNNNFKCDKCDYLAYDKVVLKRHLKMHKEKESLECEQCGVICHGRMAKQVHLRDEHQQNFEEYPCPVCGKSFLTHKEVSRHMRQVHSGKRFFCDVCGVGFKQNCNLKDHKQRFHEPNRTKQHICSSCGKAYFTSNGLRFHVNSTHVAEEEKGFGCPYCQKRFHREDLARKHVKTCMKQRGLEVPDDEEIEVEWSAAAVEERIKYGRRRSKLISGRVVKESGEGSKSYGKFLY